eukprot:TRINITY_DN10303_c0_g1_i10.p2 TRINITY_DN10303_c0_g1~~TRINITY_DN10303_c0_g1_i10.p2  ORF type:complete len:582 (+),score=114.73 TRINITY_DN10303_c0_g1_i10:2403-4148(+)
MKVRLRPRLKLAKEHPAGAYVELESGVNIIGRGEDTKCKVALCSRKQIQIDVADNAKLTALGKRPCHVRRLDGSTYDLKKGDGSFILHNGDVLVLLAGHEEDASFDVDIVKMLSESQSTADDDEMMQGQHLNDSTPSRLSDADKAPVHSDSQDLPRSNILFPDKHGNHSEDPAPVLPNINVSSVTLGKEPSQTSGNNDAAQSSGERVVDHDQVESALQLFDEDEGDDGNSSSGQPRHDHTPGNDSHHSSQQPSPGSSKHNSQLKRLSSGSNGSRDGAAPSQESSSRLKTPSQQTNSKLYNAITPARTPAASKPGHKRPPSDDDSDHQGLAEQNDVDGDQKFPQRKRSKPLAEPERRQFMDASLHLPDTSASSDARFDGVTWSRRLYHILRHPGDFADMVVYQDDDVVMIVDGYRKARYHYLILPKEDITHLSDLKREHAPLVRHMAELARDFVQTLRLKAEATRPGAGEAIHFRMGFHAIPSMPPVHMHLISEDFDSPNLKNKKHWNSFTSEYFVGAKVVYKALLDNGSVHFDKAKYEAMLKQPLRCHRCRQEFKTLPKLKIHIQSHLPPAALALFASSSK